MQKLISVYTNIDAQTKTLNSLYGKFEISYLVKQIQSGDMNIFNISQFLDCLFIEKEIEYLKYKLKNIYFVSDVDYYKILKAHKKNV